MSSTLPYRLAFDLDDVLCERDSEEGGVEKYLGCKPIQKMIDIVNQLYDDGHMIIVYTARGMNQFDGRISEIYDRLYALTKTQLDQWGVKHHRLIMGKVHYDLLIDDKVMDSMGVKSVHDVYERLDDDYDPNRLTVPSFESDFGVS